MDRTGMRGRPSKRTPELDRLMHYFDSLVDKTSAPVDPIRVHLLKGMIPLLPDQFMYAVDYAHSRLYLTHGIEQVLGYRDDEMDIEGLFTIIHPDDLPIVSAIVERAVRSLFERKAPIIPFSSVMSLDYRMRKANGTYIKVLRQVSVIAWDAHRSNTIQTISICKDISNIKPSEHIGWQATGPGTEHLDMSDLLRDVPNVIYRPSPRELDILSRLAEGMDSREIAEELRISAHTVNTHRKNLLSRTGASNTVRLLAMAYEQGWVLRK